MIMSNHGTKNVKIFQTSFIVFKPVIKKMFGLNVVKFFLWCIASAFVIITFSNH